MGYARNTDVHIPNVQRIFMGVTPKAVHVHVKKYDEADKVHTYIYRHTVVVVVVARFQTMNSSNKWMGDCVERLVSNLDKVLVLG